ncbi:MAG: MFS transporter [Candidatus Bathyarchaeota archaeon]|nr:MFS transporter [Candidatus Termiticorpusculum sp.]
MSISSERKLNMGSKTVVINVILAVNALVWYLYFFSFLKTNSSFAGTDFIINIGFSLLAVVLSAVLSTKLIQKIENRLKFLFYWMLVGALLSPISLFVGSASFFSVIIISGLIGVYFGFGFPVLMGYYSATTKNTQRAKTSGLTLFLMTICLFAVTMITKDAVSTAIVLTVWKLGGLIAIMALKPSETKINKEEKVSYKSILKMRSVLLYFAPWLIFSIVNNFAYPVLYSSISAETVTLVATVGTALTGFFAVFFGFLADRFGRKYLLVFGFTLIGLGYATLALFSEYGNVLWLYTVVDSIAWGIFAPLFLLTLWGDIAGKRDSEKFFVIGFLPYLLSNFLGASLGQYVAVSVTNLTVVFSFIGFFLFLTAIPLFMAPETLSEKEINDNELQRYIEKVQKIAEKQKNGK